MVALRAQGATEYLVLLAVVLIVALISVALLGFFPGMASDSQITQSQIYWKSQQPIAIVEVGWTYKYNGLCWSVNDCGAAYIRIRNTGTYSIRLSKMLGGNSSLTTYYNAQIPTTPAFTSIYLAPGEETCFGSNYGPGSNTSKCNDHSIFYIPLAQHPGDASYAIAAAKSLCNADGTGVMSLSNFGFEYIQYIEGQQITKRFVGSKDLMIKCTG